MCEVRELWEGGVEEKLVRADLQQKNGEEYPYGDRRQELVFIGVGLNHGAIQKVLDECLLTDAEMELGPEKWEEQFAEEDKVQLDLGSDGEEGEEGDESDEGEENGEEEENGDAKEEGKEDAPPRQDF